MKAYLVLDLTVHDLSGFLEYAQKIPAFIAQHGGRYIVKGEVPAVMEGDWTPERVVIIEFPSNGDARAFLADPSAQTLFGLRQATTTSKLLLVDGCE